MASSEIAFAETTAVAYLLQIAGSASGRDNLGRLAGRVATTVQHQVLVALPDAESASTLATAYLQAAATQLPACCRRPAGSNNDNNSARDDVLLSEPKHAEYSNDVVQVRDLRLQVCTRERTAWYA